MSRELTSTTLSQFLAEERRIRAAYARRQNDRRYSRLEPHYDWMMSRLEGQVLHLLQSGEVALGDARILEVGCGTGHWLRELVKWGACQQNVVGVDLLRERVHEAKLMSPQGTRLTLGSGVSLPFASASFDIVAQFTVFTSILDNEFKERVAEELLRVLRPKGFVLWYDFLVSNPWNPDVRGIARMEISRLFRECHVSVRRVTLAPPLGRALASYSKALCAFLEKFGPLRTHYLGTIQPT
jgi:ubiquinone/menaquinone biosynthesis C-methylase UbiE